MVKLGDGTEAPAQAIVLGKAGPVSIHLVFPRDKDPDIDGNQGGKPRRFVKEVIKKLRERGLFGAG